MANGELAVQAKGGGGDIMTDEQFGAFELQMDFKVSEGANSGIFYYLTAAHDPASNAPLGLEYQILDDERHPDARLGIDGNRTLASLYDILPRAKLMTNVGIKYSNIEPVHDWSAALPSTAVTPRPRRYQCFIRTSPFAIAT